MGVDHHTIDRWIRLGWLVGRRQGTDRPMDAWRIRPAEVMAFLAGHRQEYRLDKVDQAWFLGMIFDGEHDLAIVRILRKRAEAKRR